MNFRGNLKKLKKVCSDDYCLKMQGKDIFKQNYAQNSLGIALKMAKGQLKFTKVASFNSLNVSLLRKALVLPSAMTKVLSDDANHHTVTIK